MSFLGDTGTLNHFFLSVYTFVNEIGALNLANEGN